MARYVISVGGTGQHIALALTRLARAQALESDIRLIALDPDVETPLPQRLRAPTPSLSGRRHPLQDGTVKAPFDIVRLGKKSFQELFVDADHKQETDIFECLFDADEGSIPVHKGMYGTPCVGATVFAEGANSDALQNLLKPLGSATQVFVCGSVVGGTGAGLIHKLVDEIRRYYNRDIFGIFMLPWFDVDSAGGAGAITPAIIARNASHGIKYFYEHTIPNLSASLLIGYPGARQTKVLRKIHVGQGDMGENPSYLHLVAARALVELPKAHTANRGVKAYGVVHDLQNEGWLLDAPWETGRTLRQLIRALRIQQNLLSFLVHETNRGKILSHYRGGTWAKLTSSAESWGSLDYSIRNNAPDQQHQPFAEQVLARAEELRQEVEFCVAWAQQLFPGELLDIPNDALMSGLAEAFTKNAESPFHWRLLQSMWKERELKANPEKPHSGADVAQYHADIIFQAALS